jgi:hypothetical protein
LSFWKGMVLSTCELLIGRKKYETVIITEM